MTTAIQLPIEGNEHLVDPPIVDFLHCDTVRHVYVVTFVPQDDVSSSETETVEIPETNNDGRRMAWQLQALAGLWRPTSRIVRLVHGGGGDFEFHFEDGKIRSLSADSPSPDATFHAYRCLQDISMTAEFAFLSKRQAQPATVA